MSAWLAVGLGAILAASSVFGKAESGSAVALGFVLTAVPSLPTTLRPALTLMGIRGAVVLGGAVTTLVAAGHSLVLGVVTIGAALCGAFLARVGATAGLAVVLIALDSGGQTVSAAAVSLYALGVLVVVVSWTGWFVCSHVVGVDRQEAPPDTLRSESRSWRDSAAHASRVAVTVAAAVWFASLLPPGMVGGHWLITSVLLTVQPTVADTGIRLAQRLSGNTVGALIAAGVLGAHPSLPIVAVMVVVLFTLAMALRPVNYTWWAVTGPPVLLVISEYPYFFPWYEGGVRLAMNLAGAAIVLFVVFGVPAVWSLCRLRDFVESSNSDSVYKIQLRRAQ